MKEKLSKIWAWLDGKKTIAGVAGWLITGTLYVINGIKPGTIPNDAIKGMEYISGALTGVGLTHKAAKTETGKNFITKLLKK